MTARSVVAQVIEAPVGIRVPQGREGRGFVEIRSNASRPYAFRAFGSAPASSSASIAAAWPKIPRRPVQRGPSRPRSARPPSRRRPATPRRRRRCRTAPPSAAGSQPPSAPRVHLRAGVDQGTSMAAASPNRAAVVQRGPAFLAPLVHLRVRRRSGPLCAAACARTCGAKCSGIPKNSNVPRASRSRQSFAPGHDQRLDGCACRQKPPPSCTARRLISVLLRPRRVRPSRRQLSGPWLAAARYARMRRQVAAAVAPSSPRRVARQWPGSQAALERRAQIMNIEENVRACSRPNSAVHIGHSPCRCPKSPAGAIPGPGLPGTLSAFPAEENRRTRPLSPGALRQALCRAAGGAIGSKRAYDGPVSRSAGH